jgi:hypothetical protein
MARNFNGTTAFIEHGAAPGVTALPISIACWFRKTNANTNTALIAVGQNPGPARVQLDLRSDASVGAASVNVSNLADVATKGSHSANVWHHGAAVFTSSTSRTAYLDGVAGTVNTGSNLNGTPDNTCIGARYATTFGGFHPGDIAEAAIWNVSLTAAEIAAMAKGVSPRLIRPTARVFYAPLIRDVLDLRGRALTVTGTTVSDHPRRVG